MKKTIVNELAQTFYEASGIALPSMADKPMIVRGLDAVFERVPTEALLDELRHRIGELDLLDNPQGSDIEILEVNWKGENPPPCVKPSVMRINGTDVGLISREEGIQIDAGSDCYPATVTITLLPRSVRIGTGQ